MGYGGFFLWADNLGVEVDQPAGYRQTHPQTALRFQAAVLKEVVEWAQLVEVGDKPQLSAGILGGHVRGYKTWNQIMRWFVSTRLFCHRGLGTSQERRNPLTDPVCCHVGAAPCCRFLSLWTKIVHPWRRRSWRPHSPPSRCPSKPHHTCLCLRPEQRRWEVGVKVNRSRRWRRRLTNTLHQGDLPCHGSLDQVWQPGPTSWCTELIIDFLQVEIICKFRRVGGFS